MATEIITNKELPRKKLILTPRLKEVTAGTKIAAGDSNIDKELHSNKASCWQQDMKIRMINRHP